MSFTIKVFSEHMKIDEQEVIKAIEQRNNTSSRIHSLTFLSEEDLAYLAEWYKKNKTTTVQTENSTQIGRAHV